MTVRVILFVALSMAYAGIIVPYTSYLKNRPIAVKLGYMPDADIVKVVSGDQRTLVAEFAVLKVLFYFGTLVEKSKNKIALPPEYFNMFKTLETAVKLDPYNMDAYYFAQAAFTWEIGRAKDVNRLLLYGMKYRTWDWYLPYFVAFNNAYFLKDYSTAAMYMRKTAEISREPLFVTLAARYFHESGRADLGIMFLDSMTKGARDKNVRDVYSIRKRALLAVKSLEEAVNRFRQVHGRPPATISEVVSAGIIKKIPEDPYGGRFYLSEDGIIRSTSKFAFGRNGN